MKLGAVHVSHGIYLKLRKPRKTSARRTSGEGRRKGRRKGWREETTGMRASGINSMEWIDMEEWRTKINLKL